MSAWNMFVKKIYWEGKKKDKNYEFKQALKDASARKGEMGKQSTKKNMKQSRTVKKYNKKNSGTRRRR